MKTLLRFALAIAVLGLFSHVFAANNSPLGFWQTIDDVTNKPKGIVEISQADNGTLFGRILKIYPRPGHDQHELCVACKGAKHNQPIVGMIFLEGLKPAQNNPNQWVDGEILDPKNGKVYHSTITLNDQGQRLSVRGYVGMPLFGRSQTWLRAKDANG